jgi:hypothetical protein
MGGGMRRRFQLSDEGKLVDRRGYELPMVVFARSPLLGCVLEVTTEDVALIEGVVGGRGAAVDVEVGVDVEERKERHPLTPTNRIWSFYVETMKPRRKELGPQERQVIERALKEATEEECIRAIRGCAKSRWHMGDNDHGKKYNQLTNILKGKRNGRTLREQIDLMLDIDKANDSAELPSGELAEIEAAKRTIRQYAAYIGELPQRFVAEAREKLMAHGIEVTIIQHEPPTPIEISFSDGVRT